jgi:uncharacterized protein
MNISMYRASVPVFQQMLPALSACLRKGADYAAQKKFDPAVLLQSRLYPDMLPLVRQVQIAADFAKGTAARLAGLEVPKYEDTETSFEQLYARIQKTLNYIGEFKPPQIDGSEEREVTMAMRTETRVFKGENYLVGFALPNFFFHVTTAYAILRHNGVEVGKADFIRAPG